MALQKPSLSLVEAHSFSYYTPTKRCRMVITLTDLETRPTLAKIHGKTKKERHHLQHLYHNTTGSDVALSFDHYKVPAHKPWLSKGSHLFKVAFQSGFTVATAAEYKIEGYAPEVVFAMIKHLYCLPYLGPHSSSYDKLNLLVGVYQIANEYQIETLTENATKNYSFFLADLHQTPEFTLAVQHVAQLYQEEDLPLDLAQAVVDVCHLVLSRREHDDLLRVLEEHQPIHTGLACLRRSTFHHASNLLTVDTPRAHDRAPTDWTPTLKEM
jgi:hypothetical protein